jgi:dynein heavy chain
MQDMGRTGAVSVTTLQAELNELEHDINLRNLLWNSMEEWDKLIKEWLNKQLDEIKIDSVQMSVNRFNQNIYLLEKGLPHNELTISLKDKVVDFRKTLPIIIALRNQSLKPRHYNQIRILIGRDLTDEQDKVTMAVLLDIDVILFF